MATPSPRQKLLAIAAKEVGYAETPANSNKTKYGKWFGFDGVAWCAIFVSWCYAQAGITLPRIGFSKPGFAGCQTAVAFFIKNRMVVKDPQPGDIVFFDWNGDGRYDHVGIYRRPNAKRFDTYEGNTSLTNQSNGGQVMERTRDYKNALFVRVLP